MLPSFFIHLRRHVQAGGTVLCRVGQRPHRWRGPAAAASALPSSAWKRKSEWIKENSSAYCKYWEGEGAFSNIVYIDVKIEKLYLESALHGLSWKGKAYVIYLWNWTISGIACGELQCTTVAFKVSSLFCFDHFSLSSSPLLSSSPVLPRTSVSLCHFPNFKVSQFICCHCEVKFNCLSLEL